MDNGSYSEDTVKVSETAFLTRATRLLQSEDESFPALLQRLLGALEETWPPLRASLSLSGGVVIVTGLSEFPAGGDVTEFPVTRGQKTLGNLVWEVPPGARSEPVPSTDLGQALAFLVAQEAEIRRLRGVSAAPSDLVGTSGVMQEVFRMIERGAGLAVPVLLIGESGVGKARLAAALHRKSSVSDGPFVTFNGTALPESMVESELFGHPRALGGRYEEAARGTLLLDEVGDLSLPVQARLVRVLEGSLRPPRLIATTSRDLQVRVAEGRFRPDLLALLSTFPIQVPPLRERGADIIALADHFTTQFSRRTEKTIMRISTPALEMLLTYPWPGNVRELESVMERAVLLSDDEVIHGYHLPPSLQSSVHSGTRMPGRLADRLDSLEYEMLVEALKTSRGNITQAGRELGLTKRIMGLRMAKYELDYRTFRQGPEPDDLASSDDSD